MKSIMTHQFSRVPQVQIPRSSFDRSHGLKTTFDQDYLYPIFVDEVLPGDTFNLNTAAFARLSTPIDPIMDNMFIDTFFFFVPNRLVWNNFQKMMGEQDNPGDSVDYIVPTCPGIPSSGYSEGSIFDYFGIPTKVPDIEHSALPLRAYNLIYNEWFRDQNLQDSVTVNKGDGPDPVSDYALLRRGKRHDYFTSCLPWPQKGEAVDLPLGNTAPIVSDGTLRLSEFGGSGSGILQRGNSSTANVQLHSTGTASADLYYLAGLEADLSVASAATINQLREAMQVQRMYEIDARGGTRYIEIIKSHFGVTSPDARLQRSEYLGGGSSPINITPIPQQSETGTTPQGNLAAMGTASFQNHGFTKSFVEHGFVIGLVNVRADITYQQGLNRFWSRQDKLDYFWPSLSTIGEQAVLNKEIYAQGTTADDDVFGYQERFGEYRYKPSMITGLFRSNSSAPLDSWHLSQEFGSLPGLNAAFIEANTPMDRVVAVTSEPKFIADFYFKLQCARPMPLYGVPGSLGRF